MDESNHQAALWAPWGSASKAGVTTVRTWNLSLEEMNGLYMPCLKQAFLLLKKAHPVHKGCHQRQNLGVAPPLLSIPQTLPHVLLVNGPLGLQLVGKKPFGTFPLLYVPWPPSLLGCLISCSLGSSSSVLLTCSVLPVSRGRGKDRERGFLMNRH